MRILRREVHSELVLLVAERKRISEGKIERLRRINFGWRRWCTSWQTPTA
jgi:hypothetical protein